MLALQAQPRNAQSGEKIHMLYLQHLDHVVYSQQQSQKSNKETYQDIKRALFYLVIWENANYLHHKVNALQCSKE